MRPAVLREGYDLEAIGTPHAAFVRLHDSFKDLQQRGLSAAIGTHQADPHTWRKNQVQILKEPAAAESLSDPFGLDQAFGLAVGGRKVDPRRARPAAGGNCRDLLDQPPGRIDARPRFSRPSLGTTAQPFD